MKNKKKKKSTAENTPEQNDSATDFIGHISFKDEEVPNFGQLPDDDEEETIESVPMGDGGQEPTSASAQADMEQGSEESLPIREYMDFAHGENSRVLKSRKSEDAYRTPLWHFLWLLKGHQEMAKMSARELLTEVEEWMLSRGHWPGLDDAWRELFPGTASAEDGRVEILHGWKAVRFAPGFSPMKAALELAREHPLEVPEEKKATADYELFISLAGWLQFLAGDRNIFLPRRTVGPLLGVSGITVSRYCGWAVDAGFLRPVKKGRFSSVPGQSRADEYRFDVSLFSELNEKH